MHGKKDYLRWMNGEYVAMADEKTPDSRQKQNLISIYYHGMKNQNHI